MQNVNAVNLKSSYVLPYNGSFSTQNNFNKSLNPVQIIKINTNASSSYAFTEIAQPSNEASLVFQMISYCSAQQIEKKKLKCAAIQVKRKQKKSKLYAVDKKRGYSCYITDSHINPEKVEELRLFVKAQYEKDGYIGFDIKYDQQFDVFAKYLYVENAEKKVVSVLRVVHRNIHNHLSFEQGNIYGRPNDERYIITEKHAAESNSLVFTDFRSCDILMTSLAHYCLNAGVTKIYCLVNIAARSMNKYYNSLKGIDSIEFKDPIYFDSYGRSDAGEFMPTLWKIKEFYLEEIIKRAELIKNY